ncbi:MAG: GNAT family N-acetyltransferase [Candidatus Omnitrophica bacterium]|nr:GNAT family N-acetyltransferase [Candidatus Omnitrophota bacterium]
MRRPTVALATGAFFLAQLFGPGPSHALRPQQDVRVGLEEALAPAAGLEETAKAANIIRKNHLVEGLRGGESDATVVSAFLNQIRRPPTDAIAISRPPLSEEPYRTGPLLRREMEKVSWGRSYDEKYWLPALELVLQAAARRLKVAPKELGLVSMKHLMRHLFHARDLQGDLLMGEDSELDLFRWAYREIPRTVAPKLASGEIDSKKLHDALANPFKDSNDRGNDQVQQAIFELMREHPERFVDDPKELKDKPLEELAPIVESWVRLALAANRVDYSRPVALKEIERVGGLIPFVRRGLDTPFLEALGRDNYLKEFVQQTLVGSPEVFLVYLADNNAELTASLKLAEVLLSANPNLEIAFVVKEDNGVMNDASHEDAWRMISHQRDGVPDIYEKLRGYFPDRFRLLKGPGSQGLPLNALRADVAEALREADVILAEGEANTWTLNGLDKERIYLALRLKQETWTRLVWGIGKEILSDDKLKSEQPPVFVRIDGAQGAYYQNPLKDPDGENPSWTILENLDPLKPAHAGLEEKVARILPEQILRQDFGRVREVSFLMGGGLAASTEKARFLKWDSFEGEPRVFGHDSFKTVVFSRGGNTIAYVPFDQTENKGVSVYDLAERAGRFIRVEEARGPVFQAALDPDGKRLALLFLGEPKTKGKPKIKLQVRNSTTGELEHDLDISTKGKKVPLLFTPDGKKLIAGEFLGDNPGTSLRFLDLETKKVHPLAGSSSGLLQSLQASDTALVAAVADADGSRFYAMTWNLTGKPTSPRAWPLDHSARSVALSPDGRTIATGRIEGEIHLWEVGTGKKKAILEGHTGEVSALAFSPDGKRLASGSRDATVRLWDLAGLEETEPGVPSADVRSGVLSVYGKQAQARPLTETELRTHEDTFRGLLELIPTDKDRETDFMDRLLKGHEGPDPGLSFAVWTGGRPIAVAILTKSKNPRYQNRKAVVLEDVAVHPDYQRTPIAAWLLYQAFANAAQQGYSYAHWLTMSGGPQKEGWPNKWPGAERSVPFYRKFAAVIREVRIGDAAAEFPGYAFRNPHLEFELELPAGLGQLKTSFDEKSKALVTVYGDPWGEGVLDISVEIPVEPGAKRSELERLRDTAADRLHEAFRQSALVSQTSFTLTRLDDSLYLRDQSDEVSIPNIHLWEAIKNTVDALADRADVENRRIDGTLYVRVRRREDRWRIEFSDNGIGFPEPPSDVFRYGPSAPKDKERRLGSLGMALKEGYYGNTFLGRHSGLLVIDSTDRNYNGRRMVYDAVEKNVFQEPSQRNGGIGTTVIWEFGPLAAGLEEPRAEALRDAGSPQALIPTFSEGLKQTLELADDP